MLRPLVVAMLLLAAAAPAHGEWVRVETPNFVLFSEIGEGRTREYAREFERFREALGRAVPGTAASAAVPTLVFLFENQRSMASYRPLYNGKPIELSGYFVTDGTVSTIMLSTTDREEALRTIFHEYSHLITANISRQLPTWVDEGLAEYYSTFAVRPDGRGALMGSPIVPHLTLLNRERLLTLDELLSVRHDSPLYNEGSRRSVFYAQSWALVHLLLNGEPDRRAPFRQYLQRTSTGEPATDAWRAVFGEARVLRDLEKYIRQTRTRGYVFAFEKEISSAAFVVTKPSPADMHAALGELRRLATPERTMAHLDAAPDPASPHARVIRALMRIEADNEAEGLPLLTQAVRATDDWLVLYRAAVGLERIATASNTPESRAAAAAGLEALERVRTAKPELAHALALRGILLGSSDEGIASTTPARALAPGRQDYAVYHAQLLIDRGAFAEARALLGPLMSPRYPAEVREHVRSLLAHSVSAERARAAAGSGRASATGSPAPLPAPGHTIYVFRELQPGEQRIEGIFERIDCPRTGPVLSVRSGDRTWKFIVDELETVVFIVYTPQQGGTVGCGPRPANQRVYLTYRAPARPGNVDGVAVAVEFLPPDAR